MQRYLAAVLVALALLSGCADGHPLAPPATAADARAPTAIAAPSSAVAVAVSETRIDLQWTDNSSNETGFEVEISTDRGRTFQRIATLGREATAYTAAGLAPKTQYHFRVRAFNAVGPSDYSNVANARTRPK